MIDNLSDFFSYNNWKIQIIFMECFIPVFDIDFFFLLPVLSAVQTLNPVEVTTLSITVNWTLPIGYFEGFIINCTSDPVHSSGALNVWGEIFSTAGG